MAAASVQARQAQTCWLMAAASTRVAALSSLLEAEDGLLCRSILRGLLTAAARSGSSGAGLLLPTDLMCLQPCTPSGISMCEKLRQADRMAIHVAHDLHNCGQAART